MCVCSSTFNHGLFSQALNDWPNMFSEGKVGKMYDVTNFSQSQFSDTESLKLVQATKTNNSTLFVKT
jgi:hypothetical protein